MKFFIDTANVEDIKKANDMGVICGVTTNPSLIAKELGFVMPGSHLAHVHEINGHFQFQGHLLDAREERSVLLEETVPMLDLVPRRSLVGDQGDDYGLPA